MRKKSFVSIVIPIYNAEKTIEQTLISVLSQDHPDFEIILVDDCSTDSTLEIIKPFLKNKKFKLIKNKKNSGPATSRNNGIKKSKGEFVFFTDSDCVVPKNWISSLLKEYTSEKIAGVGGYLAPGSSNLIAMLEKLQNKYILNISGKKIINGTTTPMGYTNNVSYRKSILKKVNGFDESFPFPAGEDIDLKKRIVEKGYKVVYIPLPVKHIEPYTTRYLFSRIYMRSLDKKAPKSTLLLVILTIISFPIISYKIIKKLIGYKKQGVL